jgi:hypothetical protein
MRVLGSYIYLPELCLPDLQVPEASVANPRGARIQRGDQDEREGPACFVASGVLGIAPVCPACADGGKVGTRICACFKRLQAIVFL